MLRLGNRLGGMRFEGCGEIYSVVRGACRGGGPEGVTVCIEIVAGFLSMRLYYDPA